jgi:hypothetical protein
MTQTHWGLMRSAWYQSASINSLRGLGGFRLRCLKGLLQAGTRYTMSYLNAVAFVRKLSKKVRGKIWVLALRARRHEWVWRYRIHKEFNIKLCEKRAFWVTYTGCVMLCESWRTFAGESSNCVDAQELTVVLFAWALIQIWEASRIRIRHVVHVK